MKAVVFGSAGEFSVDDAPRPEAGEGEVLIEVAACGICGTDLHILHGEYPADFPLIPGHELAGTVAAVGPGVDDLRTGDRVCVDPNIVCGRCGYCRAGKVHLCETLDPIGVKRDGGFAEYCAAPRSQVYRVGEHVALSHAAMVEPLACTLRGIEQAGIRPGQTVMILGGGAIGAILAQLARLAGAAAVVVSEPIERRRELLLKLGADRAVDPSSQDPAQEIRKVDPQGADVVIEAAGLAVTARQAMTAAKRGATIVFFGVAPPDQRISVSPFEVYVNEWTIRGSFINPNTTQAAVDLLNAGRLELGPLISHTFALDEFGEAIETFGRPESYKIQIVPG